MIITLQHWLDRHNSQDTVPWLFSLLVPHCAPGIRVAMPVHLVPYRTELAWCSMHSATTNIQRPELCDREKPPSKKHCRMFLHLDNSCGWREEGWKTVLAQYSIRRGRKGKFVVDSSHGEGEVTERSAANTQCGGQRTHLLPLAEAVPVPWRGTCSAPVLEPLTLFSADWFLCVASKTVMNCRYWGLVQRPMPGRGGGKLLEKL